VRARLDQQGRLALEPEPGRPLHQHGRQEEQAGPVEQQLSKHLNGPDHRAPGQQPESSVDPRV